IDTEDYWPEKEREIFQDAIKEDVDVSKVVDRIKGIFYREIYGILDEDYTMQMTEEEFINRYDQAAEQVYMEKAERMDGFENIIKTLKENNVKTGLATSSPVKWLRKAVKRFDLEPHFDVMVSAEEIDRPGKPQPYIYLHTAEELGVEPGECVAVEDSRNGMEAAKRAGMHVIGYGSTEGQDLSDADSAAGNPEELGEELESLV
ncbi:MAG: HAD family hydrolase, partial [Candidatus Nanohaloarchaea archaeon]